MRKCADDSSAASSGLLRYSGELHGLPVTKEPLPNAVCWKITDGTGSQVLVPVKKLAKLNHASDIKPEFLTVWNQDNLLRNTCSGLLTVTNW